jgi:hypothetical protein
VLVAEGDPVNPGDVIAVASLPKEILMLDIAHGLSLPEDEVDACMVRAVGETLAEGDILAQCEKPLSRLVRTPVEGLLVDVSRGKAVIAAGNKTIQVKAGIIGNVVAVIPEYGAVIATHGSLIQGVWGNEKMGMGALHWIDSPKSNPVEASMLDDVESGQIVAGEQCLQASVFERALEKEAAGIIFDTMAPELISLAMELPFPVIVLGGFGALSRDQRTAVLLQSHAGKTACVNASAVDMMKRERPEVIVPLEGKLTGNSLDFKSEITNGLRVRILFGEFAGRVGEVEDCLEDPLRFESGLNTSAAVILLEGGKSVTVPQRNLVILE